MSANRFSVRSISRAIRLSLRVATIGTLASIPLGLFVAYALARWRFFTEQEQVQRRLLRRAMPRLLWIG